MAFRWVQGFAGFRVWALGIWCDVGSWWCGGGGHGRSLCFEGCNCLTFVMIGSMLGLLLLLLHLLLVLVLVLGLPAPAPAPYSLLPTPYSLFLLLFILLLLLLLLPLL